MDTLNIEKYGFNHTGNIFRNNPPGALVEKALLNKEGRLSRAGALCIETGERTGRSPDDKYIVDTPAVHDLIAWGNVNRPVSAEVFDQVYDLMIQYLNDKDLYIFDGFAGANRKYQYGFRVINEKASQNLFIRNLLIRPKKEQLKDLDVLFVPVGGFYTINGTQAAALVKELKPHLTIPMHFRNDEKGFGYQEISMLGEFLMNTDCKTTFENDSIELVPDNEQEIIVMMPANTKI